MQTKKWKHHNQVIVLSGLKCWHKGGVFKSLITVWKKLILNLAGHAFTLIFYPTRERRGENDGDDFIANFPEAAWSAVGVDGMEAALHDAHNSLQLFGHLQRVFANWRCDSFQTECLLWSPSSLYLVAKCGHFKGLYSLRMMTYLILVLSLHRCLSCCLPGGQPALLHLYRGGRCLQPVLWAQYKKQIAGRTQWVGEASVKGHEQLSFG